MARGSDGRPVFKGACGVFTCLLVLACGPDVPARAPPVEASPRPQPQPPQEEPPSEQPPEQPPTPDWYVSAKGSNEAAGTREAPLRTIGRAVALAKPGQVIGILPGVYAENLVLGARGEGALPITLRGEGTPLPTLVPGDTARSSVIRVSGRWSLENLRVDVGGARMFAVLFESGAHQSVLAGSELYGGTSGAGVLLEGARDITLRNNTVRHFIKPGDDAHGVLVVGPSRNITLLDNDIHHTSGDAIQCQAGATPAEGVLIAGNTLHDAGENGVDIKQCHGVTVRGNDLFGFPNTALRETGTSAGEAVVIHHGARGIAIQDNTISRAGRGVSVLGGTLPPENVRVTGNHVREIRNVPAGNGQGIRIAGGRSVEVVDNTLEDTASYALMLAADGTEVSGLVVRNNTLRGGSQPLLLRLGRASFRPGLILDANHYALGGILKADGVRESLSGELATFQSAFSGEQLLLSSQERLEAWRQVLGVDQQTRLLE